MTDRRVAAPDLTFAMLRTAPPATGSPPSAPDRMFAAPWPRSSRSRSARGGRLPVRRWEAISLSVATADSRDSTLPTRVTVRTAAMMPRTGPSGSSGRAWLLQDGRSTRGRVSPASAAKAVAVATAASAAGTLRRASPTRPGSRGQPSSTARVTALTPSAAGCRWANWPGSPSTLATAELCGVPPRTMCSWASAIVTPTPASMPCTMAGLTMSAERAVRSAASPSWQQPASTVTAQVVRHP